MNTMVISVPNDILCSFILIAEHRCHYTWCRDRESNVLFTAIIHTVIGIKDYEFRSYIENNTHGELHCQQDQ